MLHQVRKEHKYAQVQTDTRAIGRKEHKTNAPQKQPKRDQEAHSSEKVQTPCPIVLPCVCIKCLLYKQTPRPNGTLATPRATGSRHHYCDTSSLSPLHTTKVTTPFCDFLTSSAFTPSRRHRRALNVSDHTAVHSNDTQQQLEDKDEKGQLGEHKHKHEREQDTTPRPRPHTSSTTRTDDLTNTQTPNTATTRTTTPPQTATQQHTTATTATAAATATATHSTYLPMTSDFQLPTSDVRRSTFDVRRSTLVVVFVRVSIRLFVVRLFVCSSVRLFDIE